MATEIRVPRLGWSMEEGTFQGWLKKDGDSVQVGDALFELEGEKAVQEIEAVDAGILCIPPDAPKPGTVILVGTLLGYLLAAGEAAPTVAAADQISISSPGTVETPREAPVATNLALPPAAPSVRRLARELSVTLGSVTGTGSHGRITADDVRAKGQPSTRSPKTSSPRARRVARELGIDWSQLEGSGGRGRVREADIRRAAQHQPAVLSQSSRRKVIAERMRISRERTVPVTLTTVADATNLVGLRNQFKHAAAPVLVPSYADIMACLVAAVLRQHPGLAGRWNSDQTGLQLPANDGFHIGIAVDTRDGLLVPVIRDVGRSSLASVVSRSKDLVARARAGKLGAADMQDGVFTITSLGAYGIDAFTPVINYPEIAILGIGAIRREAIVLHDDRIVPGDRITLSLTFDHCAVDGAPAAAFLRDVCRAVENPAPYLLAAD